MSSSSDVDVSVASNAMDVFDGVMEKYRETNKDFKTSERLIVYGSSDKPLFSIKNVEAVLDKTRIAKVLSDDKKKDESMRIYREGFDYIKTRAKLVDDNQVRNVLFFTYSGLYKYIMSSRGVVSNIFRNFIIIVLEELRLKGYATLVESIEILREKMADTTTELEEARKYLDESEQLRGELADELGNARIVAEQSKYAVSSIEKENKRIVDMIDYEREYFPGKPADVEHYLRKRFMKTLKIHIVDPAKVNAKFAKKTKRLKELKSEKMAKRKKADAGGLIPRRKMDMVDHLSPKDYDEVKKLIDERCGADGYDSATSSDDVSEEEDELFQAEFNQSTARDYSRLFPGFVSGIKPDPDETYYYRISTIVLKPTNGIHVDNIYYADNKHLEAIKENLSKNYSALDEKKSDIYEISIKQLNNVSDEEFVRLSVVAEKEAAAAAEVAKVAKAAKAAASAKAKASTSLTPSTKKKNSS